MEKQDNHCLAGKIPPAMVQIFNTYNILSD